MYIVLSSLIAQLQKQLLVFRYQSHQNLQHFTPMYGEMLTVYAYYILFDYFK